MHKILVVFASLLPHVLGAQSWSYEIGGSGGLQVTGLQNNDLLACRYSAASCAVTRLDAYGAPIWSTELYPGVHAAWGGVEQPNGDLLCCIQAPDPLDSTAVVNGVLRLTSTGVVVRMDLFRSAPLDPNNARSSYLVPHAGDDQYHFVYFPSIVNEAKLFWMSPNDDVLGSFWAGGNAMPVFSIVEHYGSLYAVGTSRMAKLNYDGSLQWSQSMGIAVPAHHMYEVKASEGELFVRYQFDVSANRRPAVAVFDTTGQLLRDMVLDVIEVGTPSECKMAVLGQDILIGAHRLTAYDLMLFRLDSALTAWSAWTDDRLYSTLNDCEPVGSGIVLSGVNNQISARFFSRSGPDGDFAACWTPLPIDTIQRPWPALNPVVLAMVTFDPLLVQVVPPALPHTFLAASDCIALGTPMTDADTDHPLPFTVEEGGITVFPSEGLDATDATLLDATGRVVGAVAVHGRATLAVPAAGHYLLLLRIVGGETRSFRVVVPR